jgi:single-stranded DNA-binding protein
MDMNLWVGVGRLAENVKYYPATANSSARATGRIIVNRPTRSGRGEKVYDAINIVAWDKHAENLARYTSKGKELTIRGELRTSYRRRGDGSYDNFCEIQIHFVSYGLDSSSGKMMKAIESGDEMVRNIVAAAAAEENPRVLVAQLIEKDPDLAAKLRKVAQSARPRDKLPAEQAATEVIPLPSSDSPSLGDRPHTPDENTAEDPFTS